MTNVVQRHLLACPYGLAKAYLQFELGSDRQLWHLRVPTPAASVNPLVEFAKDVDVTVRPSVDPMHFDQPWNITWAPHGGGPYPTFVGTLTVRADEDWNVAALELVGSYEPPMGAAGKVFDVLFGARLASATAKDLLAEIGQRLEAHYHRDEAAKVALT